MKPTSITETSDSDDAPTLAQEDFDRGKFLVGFKNVSREEWQKAARTHLSERQTINITLDSDVLVWLKKQTDERSYQPLVNAILREVIQHQTFEPLLQRVILEELTHEG